MAPPRGGREAAWPCSKKEGLGGARHALLPAWLLCWEENRDLPA